jgi:catechol 2,3-dioxygenase
MALAWSHVVLNVKDKERMLDFYTRVLGFKVTDQGSVPGRGFEIIFLSQDPAEHHQLALVPGRKDEGPSNSTAHMAFRVEGMAELRRIIDGLNGEKVGLRPASHGNTWSVYFQDPEKNGVEIFADTPWHVQQPMGKEWDMTLDDRALLAWTEATFRAEPGFVTKADYVARREAELAEG